MYFVKWEVKVEKNTVETIYPDGCQDLIVMTNGAGELSVFTSPIDSVPRTVQLHRGDRLVGYRLPPGCVISPEGLQDFSSNIDALEEAILIYIASQEQTIKIVETITASDNISEAASTIGVSPRTLQRHLKKKDLPPYNFWQSLNRAREAVNLINTGKRVLDIAVALKYSDQAHMTREFVRWFGLPPSALKYHDAFSAVTQSGLGNWTAEQISTR